MGWVRSCRSGIAAIATALAALGCAEAAPAALADSFQPSGLATANDFALSAASLYPVGGPAMLAARSIADRYWHGEPCRGEVAISWAAMGSSVNAIATWSNRSGAYADPARDDHCSVRFNSDQAFDWPSLCTVFAHEFGHLTGHRHASDPSDVMYPVYSVPLPACADTPAPATGQGSASEASRVATTGSAARAGRSRRHRGAHRRSRAHRSPRARYASSR
jgi:Matrixin